MPPGAPPQSAPTIGQSLNSFKEQFSMQHFTLKATSWLALIGSGLVVISAFFPWWMATDSTLGVTTTDSGSLTGAGRFFAIASAVAVITLAWPAFVQTDFTRKRKIGLVVAVAVLTLLVVLLSAAAPSFAKSQGEDNATIAFGVILCWAGVIVIWVSVIRVWRSARVVKDATGW
jgi:hypothetical protein